MCRLSLWLASTTYISRASQGNNNKEKFKSTTLDISRICIHTHHILQVIFYWFSSLFFVSYNVCIPHPPPTTWRCVSHSSFLIHKWRMRLSEGDNQSIMRRVFSHRKSPSHTFFSLKNEEKLTIVIVIEGFAFFLVLFGSFWKRWFFSLAAHSFILQLYHVFI